MQTLEQLETPARPETPSRAPAAPRPDSNGSSRHEAYVRARKIAENAYFRSLLAQPERCSGVAP